MQRDRRWIWAAFALAALAGLALGALAGYGLIAPKWAATATPTHTPSATATRTASPSVTPTASRTPTATATPTPTRTPRPPRPIRKIGPEVSGGTNVDLGRPPIIKLRNVSREYVAEVRDLLGPDTLIIIRFQWDEPALSGDPQKAARDWYARRRADILAMKQAAGPNIAFETAVNECPNEMVDWYVPFSLELIGLMHADDVRCVAGNPAVGQWNEKVWPKFKPVLEALQEDDFLGVHEYWSDEKDIQNRWLCGRWSIPDIAAVLGDVKIVVTECGRDQVAGRGQPGWQLTTDAEQYLWELETYDILLRQFPNVVGATVFTIDKNWGSFDLYGLWPQVVLRYSLTPTPQPSGRQREIPETVVSPSLAPARKEDR